LFLTPPFTQETEITGPVAAKLWVSSSTQRRRPVPGAAAVRSRRQGGVVPRRQRSAHAYRLGWLRASHRKLDAELSLPYRPYHTHDEKQPLTPGEPVELDIEIWPTCIVIPPGYRFGLAVRGKDYQNDTPPLELDGVAYTMQGVGPFKHDEPSDRPPEIYGGKTAVHFAPGRQPYVLLPVIPPKG
jgi:uncharacterized protein